MDNLSQADSEAYFVSRPRGSRLGAWSSPQSQPLKNRQELEKRFTTTEAQFAGREIPLPPRWGGFRLAPSAIEFWQGRPNRLHDRFRYTRQENRWQVDRLAP